MRQLLGVCKSFIFFSALVQRSNYLNFK